MAESVESEHEWNDWALDSAEDSVMAIETLIATLRAFEDVLKQQEISVASSTEYCDNFCQALMHYAGSRNSMEHGLPLLDVYCLSINCFAAARSHLTAESDSVALVLKRLALSCFELLLSVPENEIPFEAWLQFHHSVQLAHDTLLQYGSTDLQALLQITGEGGAWSNPVLSALLTGQPTIPEEVDAYIRLEGEGFMEMRVKHLEKMGEVAKAVVLSKACCECSFITNQAMFRQTFVSQLCHLLPNEEAIMEISRLDCKDVLEITCNLETEGEENTAFILCTTYLTQQLQQQNLYCSWELIQLWSKLQRKLDPSLVSLLERCLQLGAIAKTVQHLLYLVRVIQTEAEDQGVPCSVELCVKILQLPKQDDSELRTSVCKTVSCLLPNDLEVLRACQLTEFLLGPSQESFTCLEELYLRPDHKYDQENEVIPNSLRCELLLALKAYWPFDPEFWDWKTLKCHCKSLLGMKSESEEEEEEMAEKQEKVKQEDLPVVGVKEESESQNRINGGLNIGRQDVKPRPKFSCLICKRSITDIQIIHHSRRHIEDKYFPCPACLETFKGKKDLVIHMRKHIKKKGAPSKKDEMLKEVPKPTEEDDDDMEPGEIPVDPSLMMYYKSTRDPEVLNHIVQQASTMKEKEADDDEYITFDYIDRHFKLQNREKYPCPGTNCTRVFKHSKYLYVHLKAEHTGDENVKYFHQIRDNREKCVFCKRHFISAYHHRKHRKVHYGERPYMCVVIGCGERFKTSNELVTHKQIHGYQLNYQCGLKGCYISYSDLGQIYHHEAQHFRDAAFTCCGTGCKKFYLSKKDFLKHLTTHKITFTERDFESQRKAKRKCFKTVRELSVQLSKSARLAESVNGDVLNSQTMSCASSLQEPDIKEPKATVKLVAMCFDGSKFICGFEKCGMTFSRARDVQRHLKCAHPEHLKLENKEHMHDQEQESTSTGIKTETDLDSEEREKKELATPLLPLKAAKDQKMLAHSKGIDSSSTGLNSKGDALREILIGLSKLSLNASPSHSSPVEPPQSKPDANTPQLSFHQEIMAKPPVVLLKKRPQLTEVKVKVESEEKPLTSQNDAFETLAEAKPYICREKGCSFRSAQNYSLLRHYYNLHGHSIEKAKKMTSFKAYFCQLCSKSHKEKHVLRAHYINTHNMSETSANKVKVRLVSPEANEKPTSQIKQPSKPLTNNSPKDKKSPKQERQHEAQNSTVISKNEETAGNHSPLEEEGENEAESSKDDNEQKEQSKDGTTQKLRTRRLVAKGNLCYILDKFSKPFHCVAKNCDAAFSTQGGLVRHLQLVHHYNRSQLLLEKDCDENPSPEVRKDTAKRRPLPNSDEPQRQFKCHFANCSASYHLKSSLVRHTRDYHSQPPGLIRCTFDGCSRVFSHDDALKKHMLYSHCECYDSLVVRLQSTHKNSIAGCQKKLLMAKQSSQAENSCPPVTRRSERTITKPVVAESEDKVDKSLEQKSKENESNAASQFTFKSHEEALQMCQDRCFAVYPCMVQNCNTVVGYHHSLRRHYLRSHHMRLNDFVKNADKLVFKVEQLEELIQRESARPTVTETLSSKVQLKTEGQEELENTGRPPSPMCQQSIQTETENVDFHEPKKISEKKDSKDLQEVLLKNDDSDDPQEISEKKDSDDHQKVSRKEEDYDDPREILEKEEDSNDLQEVSEKKENSDDPQELLEKEEDGGDLQEVSEKEEDSDDLQEVSEKEEDGDDLQEVSEKEEDGDDLQEVSEKEEDRDDRQEVSEKEEDRDDLQEVSEKEEDRDDLQEVSENEQDSDDLQEVSNNENNPNPQKVPEKKEEVLASAERIGVPSADGVHCGESCTAESTDASSAALQNTPKPVDRINIDKFKSLLRPLTVNLSPPYSLRFTPEETFQDAFGNQDNGKLLNGLASLPSAPVRQPLKRKNELSEQPLSLKDTQPNNPSPCPFDIAAYKPMGFESSFLKFIQETTPTDETPVKRRNTCRRSRSVKENNQLGIPHTRSKRTHSALVKSQSVTGDFTSAQNLKSILDRALTGCGDLAIKQLQYLRPVVVLERPISTTALASLFPSKTKNVKLLFGS
nr:zinc finger protein Rlf [Nothobranchius furzeri]